MMSSCPASWRPKSRIGGVTQKLLSPFVATLTGTTRVRFGRCNNTPPAASPKSLIVIGASTGGPTALADLLGGLPSDFPAGVIITQHIDPQFALPLAAWLNSRSELTIRVAATNDFPEPGLALIAGRDAHLVFINSRQLAYVPEPSDSLYRPSIDLLFESAQRFWDGQIIGALLTGIGKDGAQGLRHLRANGGHTIAQDAASSAIYGMPNAAAALGAATEILPLHSIAPRLIELVSQTPYSHAG